MRANDKWIAMVLVLLGSSISPAKGQENAEREHAEAIGRRMCAAIDSWHDAPRDSRPPYRNMLQQVVGSLNDDEVRLVGKFHIVDVCNGFVFRRWATKEPHAALNAARDVENANAAEIRLAGTGLEGGRGEAKSASVFELYLGATDGWARVEPKRAWDAFRKEEGPFAKSQVIEDFRSDFYPVIFEPLAKAYPDFAFEELATFNDDEFRKAHMLAGYLRGAPRGRNWGQEAARLLERKWNQHWIYSQIETALMGRWLEDEPAAAEKWFKEGEVEGLHWSYVDPPGEDPFAIRSEVAEQKRQVRERRHHQLGSAAGYWAARDFAAAWRWMKSCDGFERDGFEDAVCKGMSMFFDEETWGEQESARSYCLEQILKFPDQGDRDRCTLRFAKRLWMFDATPFRGQPASDKAKWLEGVRQILPKLRLSPEAAEAVIEKVKEGGRSEQVPGSVPNNKH